MDSKENLTSRFIRHARSPASAPIFFLKKKDGLVCLVVDYQGLNNTEIGNSYALPLIGELEWKLNTSLKT